ncbi:phasin [Sphingomonas deserti]|uniref:Phasin n=2 Tax=Allosphingosinicella deserti TaxID=2116704 RepID=A0A2P7QIB3_9SPHN|nr:phasin [Sphingomonas deserti]
MADETSTTEAPSIDATSAAEASATAVKADDQTSAPAPTAAPAAPIAKATKSVPALRVRKAAAAAPAKTAAPAPRSAPIAAKPVKKVSKVLSKAAPKASVARKPAPAQPTVKALPAPTAISPKTLNLNEGMRIMFNDTNVAERFQAVFGDANERAKTVIERNTRIAEELTELGRGNVEAVVASSKVAARGFETLGQEVAEFGRKSFEDASATLKSLAEVKTPADFFRLQSEFARTQFDALVAESSKLSETVLKLAGEVAEPITNRATVAAERVRTAAAL